MQKWSLLKTLQFQQTSVDGISFWEAWFQSADKLVFHYKPWSWVLQANRSSTSTLPFSLLNTCKSGRLAFSTYLFILALIQNKEHGLKNKKIVHEKQSTH